MRKRKGARRIPPLSEALRAVIGAKKSSTGDRWSELHHIESRLTRLVRMGKK